MNARALPDASEIDDFKLRLSLIRRLGLSDDAVAAIRRLQESHSLRFEEAAMRLGYVTASELNGSSSLAHVPAVHERQAIPDQRLLPPTNGYDPRNEQIRALRTELLLRHESDNHANMMTVLSPCAEEGRTQLAAELAIAFAQLGRPTLLVDADLRRPQQHVLFNANNSRGLAQSLAREEVPNFQTVQGLPALILLTAGAPVPNSLELLSDRFFESMIAEWRNTFQFVILDTPPVGLYADGLAVATITGRILSLSRAKHTPYKDTRNMMRRLAATQSRILGAVINHF